MTRLTEHDDVITPLLRWAPRLGLALGPALATCQLRPCLKLLSFTWGRYNCVRKMVFRFACAVLWKLHG